MKISDWMNIAPEGPQAHHDPILKVKFFFVGKSKEVINFQPLSFLKLSSVEVRVLCQEGGWGAAHL